MTKEYDQIRDFDAEIVAISTDDLSNARVMAERVGIPFPVLYDPNADVVRFYGVFNLAGDDLAAPSTFIIDKEGVIRFKHIGTSTSDRTSAQEVLEQLRLIEG